MTEFLIIGGALGAVIGLFHAVRLYRLEAGRVVSGRAGHAMGLYRGLWALVLWTLFGAYVLAFWIIGLVAYGIAGALTAGKKEAAS